MTHSIKEMSTCALIYLRRISIYEALSYRKFSDTYKNILPGSSAVVLVNFIIIYGLSGDNMFC
jgi:hypothetical protein